MNYIEITLFGCGKVENRNLAEGPSSKSAIQRHFTGTFRKVIISVAGLAADILVANVLPLLLNQVGSLSSIMNNTMHCTMDSRFILGTEIGTTQSKRHAGEDSA